jgi:hypothetical protein
MGEIENLPDGDAKEFLKKLRDANTVGDVRAIRLLILDKFTETPSFVRDELLAYADDRLEELKKGKLPPPVAGGKRR